MKKTAKWFFNIFDKSNSLNSEEKFFLVLHCLFWYGLLLLDMIIFPIIILELTGYTEALIMQLDKKFLLVILMLQPVIFFIYFLHIDLMISVYDSKNLKKKPLKEKTRTWLKERIMLSLPPFFCYLITFTIYFSIIFF